jgi:hypothetical protein
MVVKVVVSVTIITTADALLKRAAAVRRLVVNFMVTGLIALLSRVNSLVAKASQGPEDLKC